MDQKQCYMLHATCIIYKYTGVYLAKMPQLFLFSPIVSVPFSVLRSIGPVTTAGFISIYSGLFVQVIEHQSHCSVRSTNTCKQVQHQCQQPQTVLRTLNN